jgi:hypothetical protein
MRIFAKEIPLDVRQRVANITQEEMDTLVKGSKAYPNGYTYCPMGLVARFMGSPDDFKRPSEAHVVSVINGGRSFYLISKRYKMLDSIGRFMREFDSGMMNRAHIAEALGVTATVDEPYPQ